MHQVSCRRLSGATGTTLGRTATYVHTQVHFKYIGTESSAHGNILESGKENESQHILFLFSFSTMFCAWLFAKRLVGQCYLQNIGSWLPYRVELPSHGQRGFE